MAARALRCESITARGHPAASCGGRRPRLRSPSGLEFHCRHRFVGLYADCIECVDSRAIALRSHRRNNRRGRTGHRPESRSEGSSHPLGSRQVQFREFDPLGRELSRLEITNSAASSTKIDKPPSHSIVSVRGSLIRTLELSTIGPPCPANPIRAAW